MGVQVVMPDYHGAGVAPVQLFEQPAHSLLLCHVSICAAELVWSGRTALQ